MTAPRFEALLRRKREEYREDLAIHERPKLPSEPQCRVAGGCEAHKAKLRARIDFINELLGDEDG